MTMQVRCPRCGRQAEIPAGLAGETLTCPACGATFRAAGPAKAMWKAEWTGAVLGGVCGLALGLHPGVFECRVVAFGVPAAPMYADRTIGPLPEARPDSPGRMEVRVFGRATERAPAETYAEASAHAFKVAFAIRGGAALLGGFSGWLLARGLFGAVGDRARRLPDGRIS